MPITAKLMAKPMIDDIASCNSCVATTCATAWGTRRSTTSSVIAIANTASVKNRTRSYSRFPALASG